MASGDEVLDLMQRAEPRGPRALAKADPGSALALAAHCCMLEAGFEVGAGARGAGGRGRWLCQQQKTEGERAEGRASRAPGKGARRPAGRVTRALGPFSPPGRRCRWATAPRRRGRRAARPRPAGTCSFPTSGAHPVAWGRGNKAGSGPARAVARRWPRAARVGAARHGWHPTHPTANPLPYSTPLGFSSTPTRASPAASRCTARCSARRAACS